MAESFSIERRKLMRFLGAKVILTPAAEKGTGMLNKAIELAERHGWFLCRQFRSEEHTSELQSLMRISYAVFCLKKKYHNLILLFTYSVVFVIHSFLFFICFNFIQ